MYIAMNRLYRADGITVQLPPLLRGQFKFTVSTWNYLHADGPRMTKSQSPKNPHRIPQSKMEGKSCFGKKQKTVTGPTHAHTTLNMVLKQHIQKASVHLKLVTESTYSCSVEALIP